VGNHIFTLPVCLRNPTNPGYPLSDDVVFSYFQSLSLNNDMSINAHMGVASFFGAAHVAMHDRLKSIQAKRGLNGPDLRNAWHELIERDRPYRLEFYRDVVQKAKKASGYFPHVFRRTHRLLTGNIDSSHKS